MMSRIDRIRRAVSARRTTRTETDRADEAEAAGGVNLPVPVGPAPAPRTFRSEPRSDAEFVAQILGQDGQRRGLRAGPSLLEIARAAYNRIEWSGGNDRRARKGGRARTDI